MGPGLYLRPQAGLAVGYVGMARRRQRQRLSQAVVGGGNAQHIEVRKALEDRPDRITGPLCNLHGRRHLLMLPEKRQKRLDDQLLGPLAAEPTAIDARGGT